LEKNNREFFVTEDQVGQRIDKLLGQVDEIGSRSRAADLIAKGLVLVNKKPTKASYSVELNDIILFELPEKKVEGLKPADIPLNILFEDQDIVVINKQAGLVVHPAAGHEGDTLVNALLFRSTDYLMKFDEVRPGIVHRLDKDTSGVMVVAKNDLAHEKLTQQFKDRTIERVYYAITYPCALPQGGIIQSYLARHPADRKRYASVKSIDGKIIREFSELFEKGKWAITEYKIERRHTSGLCLFKLKLQTGRTHQIRVHLSEHGASLLADPTYGLNKKVSTVRGSETQALVREWPRLALHAETLGFYHPRTNDWMKFSVDWPTDIKEFALKLGFKISGDGQ